eukprot:Gb_39551 [translate_table: standard]
MGMMEKAHICELCRKQATLYCEADSAFLCWECDVKVHEANFLVAKHGRIVLCCKCNQFSGKCTSGPCPLGIQALCGACCKFELNEQTSLCISTAESAIPGPISAGSSCPRCSLGGHEANRKETEVGFDRSPANGLHAEGQRQIVVNEEGDGKVQFCFRAEKENQSPISEVSIEAWSYSEEVSSTLANQRIPRELSETKRKLPRKEMNLVNTRHKVGMWNAEMKVGTILTRWYRDLNLRSPSTIPLAMHLAEKALHKLCFFSNADRQKVRIALAASLWLAANLCENRIQLPIVKKLEDCTGIPSKLILLAESRLSELLNWKMQEEGWAECSA